MTRYLYVLVHSVRTHRTSAPRVRVVFVNLYEKEDAHDAV